MRDPPKRIEHNGAAYLLCERIGKGGFGHVYRVKNETTGQIFACKCLNKHDLKTQPRRDSVQREIKIHRSIAPHPNIVTLIDAWEEQDWFYVITELWQTDLRRWRAKNKVAENDIRIIMRQLCDGCLFLHSQNIMHRDIKLGNVLFNPETKRVAICDFGLAAVMNEHGRVSGIVGTPNYIAPEVLAHSAMMGYQAHADAWSLGVCLVTLWSNMPPFETDCVKSTYRIIKTGVFKMPVNIPADAAELASKLLTVCPRDRMSIEDARKHCFVAAHEDDPTVDITPVKNVSWSDESLIHHRFLDTGAFQCSYENETMLLHLHRDVDDLQIVHSGGGIDTYSLATGNFPDFICHRLQMVTKLIQPHCRY